MRVIVTGGAGYVGSQLVPALLNAGHSVVVYDTFWFGDHLPREGARLAKLRADIRNVDAFEAAAHGCDAAIHLACLSNDPSSEIDRDLTQSINLDAFEPLVLAAKAAGVRRFINCSSSSVYGISDAPDVREDHPLVPLTLYNKFKAQCEPLLFKHQSPAFECVNIRPSTVCGYSPRQRLDLVVNIFVSQAYHNGRIIVLGGDQRRPNLHIDDMVDCYLLLLSAPAESVAGQTFNVGAGNISISDLAETVRGVVSAHRDMRVEIERRGSLDPRSYQVNADKIAKILGFTPRTTTVSDAAGDLCWAFDRGLVPDAMTDSRYINVRRMKEVFADLYQAAGPSKFDPDAGVVSEIDMLRQRESAAPDRAAKKKKERSEVRDA